MRAANCGVLVPGTRQDDGPVAWSASSLAMASVAHAIAPCFGPSTCSAVLLASPVPQPVRILSSGSAVLPHLQLEQPAARVLAELARRVSHDVADGATSAVLLASLLAQRCLRLVRAGHLSSAAVRRGVRSALDDASRMLHDQLSVSPTDCTAVLTSLLGTTVAAPWADVLVPLIRSLALYQPRDVLRVVLPASDPAASRALANTVAFLVPAASVAGALPPRSPPTLLRVLAAESLYPPRLGSASGVGRGKQSAAAYLSGLSSDKASCAALISKVVAAGVDVVLLHQPLSPTQTMVWRSQKRVLVLAGLEPTVFRHLCRGTGAVSALDLAHALAQRAAPRPGLGGAAARVLVSSAPMRRAFVAVTLPDAASCRVASLVLSAPTHADADAFAAAVDAALRVQAAPGFVHTMLPGAGAAELAVSRSLASRLDDRCALALADALVDAVCTLARNTGVPQADPVSVQQHVRQRMMSGEGVGMAAGRVWDAFPVKTRVFVAVADAVDLILSVDASFLPDSKPETERVESRD